MKKYLAIILTLNMVFISGCWDMRQLDELALVMAVGIDKAKGSNTFTVTVQIAKPANAAGGRGGSGGGGGGSPTWTASAQGKTIFEAIRNLAKFSSRRVMWAHNNIIVIGEQLAEEDITPVVDFFTHNPELRMKTWVAVSHGAAGQYVSANTGMEDISGIALAELFRYYNLPAESVKSDMLRLFADFESDSIQPLVAGFRMKKDTGEQQGGSQVELAGAAVFKGSKMVGWLSPEEARAIDWLRNETDKAIVTVPTMGDESKLVSVEINKVKTKKTSEMSGDIPKFTFDITGTGTISEQDKLAGVNIDEFKASIEQELKERIKSEVKIGMDKVQKGFESDVLGLGRVFHIQHKDQWYSGIGAKWEKLYPESEITVNVDINIDSSALYQEPINMEKEKGGLKNESKGR